MAERANAHLELRSNSAEPIEVPLQGSRLVIGRASDVEIPLDNPSISRRHAEVFADPFGRWWVRDLGSRNGTMVNGAQVDEHLLKPGDAIQIEEYSLILRMQGPVPERPRASVGAGTSTEMNLTVSDVEGRTVSRLQDLATPKIAASHLSRLTQFSGRLLATENDQERLTMLCQLLVGKDFNGNAAVAFRLAKGQDSSRAQPQLLCDFQFSKYRRPDYEPYISRTMLRAALETETPVVASNVSSDTNVMNLSLAGDVMEMAAVACPVHRTSESLDLLYVCFPAEYGTGEWLALAALAAEQYQQAQEVWVSRRLAEQQAIMEKELAQAERIQANLIPRAVSITGLNVAIGFEPCKWVGGDYVDVLPMPNGKTLLTVCDVCGKGLQAALITASLHTLVHMGVQADLPLGAFMGRVNDYLCDMLPDESFVTAIGMTLDPATGQIEMCNAGHPPAMIVGSDGQCRQLQHSTNPPWGYLPMEFEIQSARIEPGEMLGLFTDGLTELTNEAGDMLGVSGTGNYLENVYVSAPSASADELAVKFKALLDEYQGNAMPSDDRTFMLVCRV